MEVWISRKFEWCLMLYNRLFLVFFFVSISIVVVLEWLLFINLGILIDYLDYDVMLIVVVIVGKIVLFDSFVWVYFGLECCFFVNMELFFG